MPLDLYIFYQQIHWNETRNDPALKERLLLKIVSRMRSIVLQSLLHQFRYAGQNSKTKDVCWLIRSLDGLNTVLSGALDHGEHPEGYRNPGNQYHVRIPIPI